MRERSKSGRRDEKSGQTLGTAPLNSAGAFRAKVPITAEPGSHPLLVAPDIPSDDLYFFPVDCGNAEGNLPVVVAPGTPRIEGMYVATALEPCVAAQAGS